MKTNINCRFHNKFEITVQDIRTNKETLKGYAENIVLDNMYNRLAAFSYIHKEASAYNWYLQIDLFYSIFFGIGIGELSADRTSLFTYLGSKQAVEVSKEFGVPITIWTKQIVLAPEEFVGETITELGLAGCEIGKYNSNYNVVQTHALIYNDKGTVGITKTEFDIVTITGTLYIELTSEVDNTYIAVPNQLLTTLFNGSLAQSNGYRPSFYATTSCKNILNNNGNFNGYVYRDTSANLLISDVPNRRWRFYKRLGIADSNGLDPASSKLNNITIAEGLSFNLQDSFEYLFEQQDVGVGDSLKTKFSIASNAYDLTLFLNGIEINESEYTYKPFNNYMEEDCLDVYYVQDPAHGDDIKAMLDINATSLSGYYKKQTFTLELNLPEAIAGFLIRRGNESYSSNSFTVYGSNDKTNWVLLGTIMTEYLNRSYEGKPYAPLVFNEPNKFRYYEFRITGTNYDPPAAGRLRILKDYNIIFNNPPPDGSKITATYKVNHIPKDKNFVLDIDATITFGPPIGGE